MEIDLDKYVLSGDISGMWNADYTNDDNGNILNGLFKGIGILSKVLKTPAAAISWVGHNIFNGLKSVASTAVGGAKVISNNDIELTKLAASGKISDMWKYSSEEFANSPLSGLYKAVNISQKIMKTPLAITGWVGSKIWDGLKGIKDSVVTDYNNLDKYIDEIVNTANDGDVGKVWGLKADFSISNPLHGLFNAVYTVNKLFGVVQALIQKINPSKLVEHGWDWLTDLISNKSSGSGSKLPSGGDSGFVSQYDPRYSNLSVSGTSFANKGCGPAVASMMASAYGQNLSVNEATRASKGYQNAGGVSIDYFGNALGSKGINTQIISGGGAADIYSNLAAGNKAVLLGRDPSNTSKAYSPFGPGNHYVLATGLDGAGNIIVNDPENNKPMVYNKNILRNTKYAVVGNKSGGRSRIKSSLKYIRNIAGGATNYKKYIWDFLRTEMGFTEAGAAGLMGCWQCESGNNPARAEGDYLKEFNSFGGFKAIETTEGMNAWCLRLFDIYRKKGVKFSASGYQMSDGNYYLGLGLAQWTRGRSKALVDFAKQMGGSWTDLAVQLAYAKSELNSGYTKVRDYLRTATDVTAAAKYACNKYEGYDDATKRISAAKSIYTEFTGTNPDTNLSALGLTATNTSTTANTTANAETANTNSAAERTVSSTTNDTEDVGIFGVVSKIGSIISDAFNNALKKNKNKNNTTTSTYQSTSSVPTESSTSTDYSSSYSSDGGDYNASSYNGNTAGVATPIDIYKKLKGYKGNMPNEQQKIALQKQKALVDKMAEVKGTLTYSLEGGKQDPDKGYGSCASTCGWAYRKVLGVNGMSAVCNNQSRDNRFTTIYSNGGNNPLDPSYLEPGDLIYYSYRNKSNLENGWNGAAFLGHTEMFEGYHPGDGLYHTWNNGGGGKKGTTNPSLNSRLGKVMFVRRYNQFMPPNEYNIDGTPYNGIKNSNTANLNTSVSNPVSNTMNNSNPVVTSATGVPKTNNAMLTAEANSIEFKPIADILKDEVAKNKYSASGSGINAYGDYANASSSAGLLLKSRVGSRNSIQYITPNKVSHMKPSAGGTHMEETRAMLNTLRGKINDNSGIDPEVVNRLLSAITSLLANIADNTSPIEKIYDALIEYFKIATNSTPTEETGGASKLSFKSTKQQIAPKQSASKNVSASGSIDSSLKELVGVLAEIAKG